MKKLIIAAVIAALSIPAYAKGFTSSRSSSFSRPSMTRSYTPPKYVAPRQNITVNRTTVVQQVQAAPSSSGGGFFSSMVGAAAGAGIASWLFSPKPAAQPKPAVIDCAQRPLPEAWVPHCPPAK